MHQPLKIILVGVIYFLTFMGSAIFLVFIYTWLLGLRFNLALMLPSALKEAGLVSVIMMFFSSLMGLVRERLVVVDLLVP
jgi:hypothetical protein